MTSKNSVNSVQFNSVIYYLCAGTAATKPLQRQQRNVKKYTKYKQQMKTQRKWIIKITPENNSINNILTAELFFQQMHPLLKHKMLQSLFKIYFLL